MAIKVRRVKTINNGKWGISSLINYSDGMLTLKSCGETHTLKCEPNDFVVVQTDGPGRISLKKAQAPKDERLRLLWEIGFRSRSRMTKEAFNQMYLDDREWATSQFPYSCCPVLHPCISNTGYVLAADVMVCWYSRTGTCQSRLIWFMNSEATLEDVKNVVNAYKGKMAKMGCEL